MATQDANICTSTPEKLFSVFANNKGADQPTHPRSLASTFVTRGLENINSTLVTQSKQASLCG